MQVGNDTSWTEFRDVFEVDGQAIRPRDDRLEDLLRHATTWPARRPSWLRARATTSATSTRNVNTPLFSLRFLEAANQRRFRFTRTT